MISSLESRGDTIQLIAKEEMLNLRSLDFDVIEKLGVWFMAPNYFEMPNEDYRKFRESYLEKNYELPTKNILIGYNLALFLGFNMNKYGKYFQVGANQSDFDSGYFRTGIQLGPWRDNQWIPVVAIRNKETIWLNKAEMMESLEQQN